MAQSAQIKNINPWHRNLADWLIVNGTSPGWNARAAEHFKVTRPWLSSVYHSDAFQDYFQRLSASHSSALHLSIKEKLTGTLDQAIEKLQDRIEVQGDSISTNNLLDVIDILGKRTGLGERQAEGIPTIQNNVLVVTQEDLAKSRERMRGIKGESSPRALENSVIEGKILSAEPS